MTAPEIADEPANEDEIYSEPATAPEIADEPEEEPEPTPEPDLRSIASGLNGATVDELYAAVGGPNSSSYSESCLVIGSEDGTLYYDTFTVSTIRYPDGSEVITGVY